MALRITHSTPHTTATEYLGGAPVTFVDGAAHITGWRLRPPVAAACRRRGYVVEFDRHHHPTPPATEPTPPAEQPAEPDPSATPAEPAP